MWPRTLISNVSGGLLVEREARFRMAAFKWLEEQTVFDDVLIWSVLQHGFIYEGERISLVGQQGIWKPRVFDLIPLSIRTSAHSPYDDGLGDDGLLHYKYRGTDPEHRDNRGLRQAMQEQVPLIYFHALSVGKYVAAWPVYIIGDNRQSLTFVVAVDDRRSVQPGQLVAEGTDLYRRKYLTASYRVRLHQTAFRTRVLEAYRSQCAFCRLKHAELLDAAHITPDRDPAGEPVVTNGLALCKIHHAAFDRHFIGVTPDYTIVVREDLLAETDGPMLRHGIQEIHQSTLILPNRRAEQPDRERLAQRFEEFRKVI